MGTEKLSSLAILNTEAGVTWTILNGDDFQLMQLCRGKKQKGKYKILSIIIFCTFQTKDVTYNFVFIDIVYFFRLSDSIANCIYIYIYIILGVMGCGVKTANWEVPIGRKKPKRAIHYGYVQCVSAGPGNNIFFLNIFAVR